ncbi:MAG: S8 family serine peptidase [bacterium]|nr:S8 family serine peptidase [bacterium]
MGLTSGRPGIVIGIIDGPVDLNHPALRNSRSGSVKESQPGACRVSSNIACMHGTFIAGILSAAPGGPAPAICPGCNVVLRPVFIEGTANNGNLPATTPGALAAAIIETVDAGAKIINLSLGLSKTSLNVYRHLEEAYDYAGKRGAILVTASGNQGYTGSSPLFKHPWLIPVAACDERGRFSPGSNIGPSIGKRGLMAPGVNITSTSAGGGYTKMSGTSAAAPFVTGAIALLWSLFPGAAAAEVKHAVLTGAAARRHTIIPPILNAEAALNILKINRQQFKLK